MSYAFTTDDRSRTTRAYRFRTPAELSASAVDRVGQRAQVPAAAGRLLRHPVGVVGAVPAGLTDGLGERGQVVDGWLGRGELALMAHDLPAARRRQPQRVLLAQIVRVRLCVAGQRTDH